MTLLMSFVTAEKKTKTNQNKTRNENKCEKNTARGKTRQKKDNLNIELFVMLNLRLVKAPISTLDRKKIILILNYS